jgi:tetratricopeptide (TPR) repeat protein
MKKLLLVLTACFAIVYVANAQSVRQYVKAGEEFAENKNYKDAIVQFGKAIELNPKDDGLYILRAEAYEKDNNCEAALEDYNRALTFDDNTKTRAAAGRAAYLLKKYDVALDHLEKALKMRASNNDAMEYKIKTLIAQGEYTKAQPVCEAALNNRETAVNYYLNGVVLENLKNFEKAEWSYKKAISKDKKFDEPYVALSNLLTNTNKLKDSRENIEELLVLNPNNTKAYVERSKIYVKQLDFPNAINDISKAIILKPEDEELFYIRGTYYQQFTQHQNAINDFNKVLMLNSKNAEALYQRASSYEQVANFKAAIKDYETLAGLSEYDGKARKLLDVAKKRLYELNRESNAPQVFFLEPTPQDKQVLNIAKDKKEVTIKGRLKDESEVEMLQINGKNIPFIKNDDAFDFITSVVIDSAKTINVTAIDVYKNEIKTSYTINRTEITPPTVTITAPYSSDNGEIYLDTSEPNVYVEGKASDENLIKSVLIDGVAASYKLDEPNPVFSATVNVANKNKILVQVTDIFGNMSEKEFPLNREGAINAADNPMGKTWVVFIENSNYQTFASLEGPVKDITLMKSALVKYKINNMIHKKDMTKKEMEKFFSIDLRDLVRSNRVDAIMVWYAGHGKFINQTGYWIPVDANRDDEFTYFNINSLRASLQSYSTMVHLLVVTDACESGPTFYQAMRGAIKDRDCGDWQATRFKSSQVLSSAGYELAADNSQFTRTFANSLANNPNACIPIENIVQKVSLAVGKNNQQKPQFGKIAGLEDEDGTFFFITK